jgi:hypothetical protein
LGFFRNMGRVEEVRNAPCYERTRGLPRAETQSAAFMRQMQINIASTKRLERMDF